MHRLLGASGEVLAEVADDRVDADGSVLGATGAALRAVGAAPSHTGSKLHRALGDRLRSQDGEGTSGHDDRGGLGPRSAARQVLHRELRRHVAEVPRQNPAVRADLPDPAYRMRVAVRRLRALLATYRPLFRAELTEPPRNEPGWLGRCLGDIRDVEVLGKRLEQPTAGPPGTDAARKRAEEHLCARHRRAVPRAHTAMSSGRHVVLLEHLETLAREPPLNASADQDVTDVMPRLLRRSLKRVAIRHERLESVADPAERPARLHDLRKAARRARYATAALTEVYGDDAHRLAKPLKRVQSALGEHQDIVVSRAELRRLAHAAAAAGENTFPYGHLQAREEAAARAAEREFHRAWRRASRKKLRRWTR